MLLSMYRILGHIHSMLGPIFKKLGKSFESKNLYGFCILIYLFYLYMVGNCKILTF